MLSSITSVHSLALQEKKYRPEATSASLPPLIKASSRGALQSDQKQAQQCYAESLKVGPYPLTREPTKSHLTTSGDTQVMSMDEGSPIQALIVYRATLDDIFDVDPRNDTTDKEPKPIEELIKLQLRPKPRQCIQLSRDLTSH